MAKKKQTKYTQNEQIKIQEVHQQDAYRQTRGAVKTVQHPPPFQGQHLRCWLYASISSLLKPLNLTAASNAGMYEQVAQLSQRPHALCVIEYFANSLKITQDHSK